MQNDENLHVVDARQAYLDWCLFRHKKLPDLVGDDKYKFIQLIPLFFQLNNKLLPGYVGADSPIGVYGYKPDKKIIDDLKLINNKIRYQKESVIKNFAVDSIFFRQNVIDQVNSCWVFYRSSLNKSQVSILSEKANKISKWLQTKNLNVDIVFISDTEFKASKSNKLIYKNKAIFLDDFYSECIYLAGKYPVWWLVPTNKEHEYKAFVEHIKQARFVGEDEYIDLGSVAELNQSDLVESAVDAVQQSKESPEISLVKLLMLEHRNAVWPDLGGVSTRIKSDLYMMKKDMDPVKITSEIMHSAFKTYTNDRHFLSPSRLFSKIKDNSNQLNNHLVNDFLLDNYKASLSYRGFDHVVSFIEFNKSIYHEIKQIFSNIALNNDAAHSQQLKSVTKNILMSLSEKSGRVSLYNNKEKMDIILDRILLRHEIINDQESEWSLVFDGQDNNEKAIEGFNSLLGLLAWCWLNRVVNYSTQVSIDCPLQQVKQIEARYVLEVLFQELNPKLISNIPAEAFENPVRPLRSWLFVNFMTEDSGDVEMTEHDDPFSFGKRLENLVTHCEQLIINSWGDVYTQQYTGEMGVLNCLCDWTHHAPLDSLSLPQKLMTYGHGEGASTYMAQRVDQVYQSLLGFFYKNKEHEGRFIVRMGLDYYAIIVDAEKIKPIKIGTKSKLMKYLESPLKKFQSTAIERLAYRDYSLQAIYEKNKKNVLQVFFQVINRRYHTWVLDEKGSLWTDVFEIYDRESYVTHWLYLFNNIRKRLKSINYQDRELPSLEIIQLSLNQLGGTDFYSIGADSISGEVNYYDVQLSIMDDELSIVCDEHRFDNNDFQDNVLAECVEYLSAKMSGEGHRPLYITDIDVPLKLFNVTDRNDIQISHFLKYKRNFEHRINKLLDG